MPSPSVKCISSFPVSSIFNSHHAQSSFSLTSTLVISLYEEVLFKNMTNNLQNFPSLYMDRYMSSSFFSSVGCADDEALTRLFQTSFLFVFWSLYQSW